MSKTAIIWCVAFVIFTLMTVGRASWGMALYSLNFFAIPTNWWWGKGVLYGQRWNLIAALILMGGVAIASIRGAGHALGDTLRRRPVLLAIGIWLNALFVHLVLAPNRAISEDEFVLVSKITLLFVLMTCTLGTRKDYAIVVVSLLLGAAYIGFEVTVNDRGTINSGRLEGVGAPGATTANDLANLMVTLLPLAGAMVFFGSKRERLLAVLCAPLMLNTVLLCNSRGAFLALIAGGVTIVWFAHGKVRKQALQGLALGGLALFFLLGDARITDRFLTTFAGEEERDSSAAGRIQYWKAGLLGIADHPLGYGGDAFKIVYGPRYIARITGEQFDARSVHNGYINDACQWGIQGLCLRLLFFAVALRSTLRVIRVTRESNPPTSFFGVCLVAAVTGMMVQSVFGTFLDKEWGYWLVALMLGYVRLYESGPQEGNEGNKAHAR